MIANKYILTTILLTCGLIVMSQSKVANLEGIHYQAVAIDLDGTEIVGVDIEGKPLYEREIGVMFSIDDGPQGSVLYYQDEHVTITDKFGQFSVVIGLGTYVSGDYTALLDIPWINGDQWLKVEISQNNDNNYRVVSHQKLMSVPYSFYTDDIADNSISTYKIINETILAEDIGTGSVESDEILDETILAEDVATGAITTDEVLDETLVAGDIATGAVTTDEILNGTIQNEDISNGTIDLTTKVTGILPTQNGGTGVDGSSAADGQLLIGNGTGYQLNTLTEGVGISIQNSPGGIMISSNVEGVNSSVAGVVPINNIAPGETFISGAIPVTGVEFGNIVVGSVDISLKGCMMTTYVTSPNNIKVAIFNGTGKNVNLGTVSLRVLVVK